MITTKLIDDLEPYLRNAFEVWIAVALIKDEAFEKLQTIIPPDCVQHFLVGIDLPTTPSVLYSLKEKLNENFKASIYKSGATYHPKIYIVKNQDQYVAFIGSANLTNGGFENNIEMSYKINDQQTCIGLIEWFDRLYLDSYPLSIANIREYEDVFTDISANNKKNTITRGKLKLSKPNISVDPLGSIDFSTRYFSKGDHLAFRKELWLNTSPEANRERKEVSNRFLELHKIIYPQFSNYQLPNLVCNVSSHICSLYYHNPDRMQKLDAMWLSYGKSQSEIKEYHKLFPKTNYNEDEDDLQSFINHARLQVRIELKEIGIWILFGKNNGGSLFDRDHFLKCMKDDTYKNDFYSKIKNLPEEYWVSINSTVRDVSDFVSPDDLLDFCKKDKLENYFIIGRDYKITDSEMSEALLPTTVLNEFKRLFPIYDMMRDKQFMS